MNGDAVMFGSVEEDVLVDLVRIDPDVRRTTFVDDARYRFEVCLLYTSDAADD